MAKKSVAKNYMYNLMYQVLIIIIPLITTPYLSRVLGAENIGIYSYTLSINTYFILFGSLGVALYGQREIAFNQDNIEKRTISFYEIFFMRIITMGIALIAFYFVFCMKGQYSFYYKILILEIVANVIDISWFFRGIEEFKKTVVRNTIVKIISVFCIFLFVKQPSDLYIYFIIYAASNFLGNFTLWMYISKYTCKISLKKLKIIKHLKPALALFIPQIAIQLYTVLDKTMIGTIVSDKSEVGFYEQAQKIVKLLLTIATSLGTVMMPRIAHTFATGNKKELKKYMDISFKFITMLTFPLMFGIVSIATSFVPIFYGNGYEKVTLLISVVSPIIVAIGFSNVIGTQYLLPTKQQTKFTVSVTIGAIINLILNFILINMYQSLGASIATVIAEICVTATQFYLVRKEISFINVLKKTYKYIISSIIMFASSMFVGIIINNNLYSIIAQICVSAFVYFGLLLLLKDSLIIDGIHKILKRSKNKTKNKQIKYQVFDPESDLMVGQSMYLYDSYNFDNINNYLDDLDRIKMKIRFDNNIIGQIDFSKCPYEISDIILSETKVYNFEFNNDYLLRHGKYPKQISNNYELMKYILDQDYNYLAYIDPEVTNKDILIDIINYAFTKVYYMKVKNNEVDFDINNMFKKSSIIKHSYFKECYSFIDKMNKKNEKSKKKA